MFGNSEEKLREKYKTLMEESFKLSRVNRRKSDEKLAEAEAVLEKLNAMEGKQGS